MQIIPAIDLIDGKCVRLTKGDYNTKTIFDSDPLKVANNFLESGVSLIHVIDLDGAKAGKIINIDTIKKLCENNIPIEVGGGVRYYESIDLLLNLGVKRVILGSVAVKNQDFLKDAIGKYGNDKIVLGLDCDGDLVSIHGWQAADPAGNYLFKERNRRAVGKKYRSLFQEIGVVRAGVEGGSGRNDGHRKAHGF